MPSHALPLDGSVLRHFTVAVFVVHAGRVLLHYHRKLGRWLPPGGHVEENELPDDAALREVLEETGVRARLVGARGLPVRAPRQLVVPAGIQVEDIFPGHQHIDLVYFAVPLDMDLGHRIDPAFEARDQVGWHPPEVLARLGATDEIRRWAERAVAEVRRQSGNRSGSAPAGGAPGAGVAEVRRQSGGPRLRPPYTASAPSSEATRDEHPCQ